jgi:hypothetical protein
MRMFWDCWRSSRRRSNVDNPGELGQDGSSTGPAHRRAATCGHRHDPAESPKCSQCWGATAQRAKTFDREQRATNVLVELRQRWEDDAWQPASANELARQFCRSLQEHPDLIGMWLGSKSIESMYQVFYRSLRYTSAPPYKDFAKALSGVMRRRRVDVWRNGKRLAFTAYFIPDPDGPSGLRDGHGSPNDGRTARSGSAGQEQAARSNG